MAGDDTNGKTSRSEQGVTYSHARLSKGEKLATHSREVNDWGLAVEAGGDVVPCPAITVAGHTFVFHDRPASHAQLFTRALKKRVPYT